VGRLLSGSFSCCGGVTVFERGSLLKSSVSCLLALTALVVIGCSNPTTSNSTATDGKDKAAENSTATDGKDKAAHQPKVLATATWDSTQLAPRAGQIRSATGAVLLSGAPMKKWHDSATMAEATKEWAKRFNLQTIDWSKQMILLVEAGLRKTGGYTVEMTALEVKDRQLIVKWKVNEPKPGSAVIQETTNPAAAVLVELFDGEVIFDPPVK
jgi:protease stability complex PrcB-like protein